MPGFISLAQLSQQMQGPPGSLGSHPWAAEGGQCPELYGMHIRGSEEDIPLCDEAGCQLLGTITRGDNLPLPKCSPLLRGSIPRVGAAPPQTSTGRMVCFLVQPNSSRRES